MALFKNEEDSIREELLKKSNEASKNAQVIQFQNQDDATYNPDKDANNKKSLAYLEANGIHANAAIEILGSKELFDAKLKDFAQTANAKFGKLIEYKASMNTKDYALESASIKKLANYLGIDNLYLMAKTHEYKAKTGDSVYVIDHFKEYEDEIMKSIQIIKDYTE